MRLVDSGKFWEEESCHLTSGIERSLWLPGGKRLSGQGQKQEAQLRGNCSNPDKRCWFWDKMVTVEVAGELLDILRRESCRIY